MVCTTNGDTIINGDLDAQKARAFAADVADFVHIEGL